MLTAPPCVRRSRPRSSSSCRSRRTVATETLSSAHNCSTETEPAWRSSRRIRSVRDTHLEFISCIDAKPEPHIFTEPLHVVRSPAIVEETKVESLGQIGLIPREVHRHL